MFRGLRKINVFVSKQNISVSLLYNNRPVSYSGGNTAWSTGHDKSIGCI